MAKPTNPLLEIAVTIAAPSLVLMLADGWLGNVAALLLALAFPVGWAIRDGWRQRRVSFLSLVGIVSTLLTGGIGLLQLDARWFAIKEGAVPAVMALAIAASAWTGRPLIHALVFDAALLDSDRIAAALAVRGNAAAFESRLRAGTLLLAALFMATAVASYLLARWFVTSPAGSTAFNQQLGRLTLASYGLVALPAMLLMMALVVWLTRQARALTGLAPGELFRGH